MMSNYLLSIAIPTYNGSKTIRTMLDILLAQYDPRVEIIISDNCSNDETPTIIAEYLQKFSFIRYIRNTRNIGPDANFLQCMREANGLFTYLLSDDDVLIEGSLEIILKYLKTYPDVSLVFLTTVGFLHRYDGVERCFVAPQNIISKSDVYSMSRRIFTKYAKYYWGFMSSFLWKTDAFRAIANPERYFNTYWLQSYIHISCVQNPNAMLGVISTKTVAAGNYVNIPNFDVSLVDGVYYRTMLDYAIACSGFDKKQLDRLYSWRLGMLGRNAIVKERASGIRRVNVKNLLKCARGYPRALVEIIIAALIPTPVCKLIMTILNSRNAIKHVIGIHRNE